MRFNKDAVLEAFRVRLGFKANDKYPLPNELTDTESGMTFNSVHQTLTNLKTVNDCAPSEDATGEADADTRREVWLSELRDEVILDAVNNIIDKKVTNGTTKDLFSKRNLFNGSGNINNTVAPSGKIVGFKIVPANDSYIRFRIRSIYFQGTEAGTIPIMLVNSNTQDLVDHLDIVYTKPNSVQRFDCDFLIDQYTYNGGQWFLCYDQSQYAGKAIYQGWAACGSCGLTSFDFTKAVLNQYMAIYPASVDNSLPNWNDLDYACEFDNNFGLSFEIEGYCDYTKLLVENASLFDNYIKYMGGIALLRSILTNANANATRNQALTGANYDRIMYDLEGNADNKSMCLMAKAETALQAVHLNLEGHSPYCFAVNNTNKVKHSVR